MSTILDALKRLEDKTLARDGRSIPGAMRGRGKTAGKRWWRPVAAVLAGLSIVGAALVVYWGYGKWSGQAHVKPVFHSIVTPDKSGAERPDNAVSGDPAGGKASQEGRPSLPSGPAKAPASSLAKTNPGEGRAAIPPAAAPGAPTRKPPQPLPRKPKTFLEQEAARKPLGTATRSGRSVSAAPAATSGVPGSAKARRSTSPQDLRPTNIKADKPAPQVAPPRSLPARDPYANAELLKKGELDLQAISWSDIASDRVTIISSRILREGQTVDGYAVIQIRPEHVILSKAERYWKLGYDN